MLAENATFRDEIQARHEESTGVLRDVLMFWRSCRDHRHKTREER